MLLFGEGSSPGRVVVRDEGVTDGRWIVVSAGGVLIVGTCGRGRQWIGCTFESGIGVVAEEGLCGGSGHA